MNFVNLPVFILFFAAVYLIGIYVLLALAQMLKQGNNPIAKNAKETKKQVEIP